MVTNYFLEIDEFQRITQKFVTMVENLSKLVEKEKIKAIGMRNILQSMEKQKENNQQQLQVNKFYTFLVLYKKLVFNTSFSGFNSRKVDGVGETKNTIEFTVKN